MNILYLCHPDNYHIKKWVQGLTRKGVSVHLAGFQEFSEHLAPYTKIKTHFGQLTYLDFLTVAPQIRELTRKIQPDVMFASFSSTFGLAAMLADATPYIVQTWSRDIGEDPEMSTREKFLISNLGYRALTKAAGITTDGMAYRERMLAKWPEFSSKTLGTPWGIDLEVFQYDAQKEATFRAGYNIPQTAPIVSSTRGVGDYYQPEALLTGILQSAKQFPDVIFVILTLAQQRTNQTEKLLQKASAFANIRVIDRLLSVDEMTAFWSATDFFIATPRFDGVSEGLSEGRAMGAIPLINNLPSNRERATENVHALFTQNAMITPADIVRLTQKALRLREEEIAEMVSRNKQWVRNFADVNHTLDNLIAFFESIKKQHHA